MSTLPKPEGALSRPCPALNPWLPGFLPDLLNVFRILASPATIFADGAALGSELFSFRLLWERWTVLRSPEAIRFFMELGPEDVDPFEFRLKMPSLALPGTRAPERVDAVTLVSRQCIGARLARLGQDGLLQRMDRAIEASLGERTEPGGGTVEDLFGFFVQLCLDGVMPVLLGDDLVARVGPEFSRSYKDLESVVTIEAVLAPWLPSSRKRDALRAGTAVAEELLRIVGERRRLLPEGPDDLVQDYLTARDGEGEPFELDDAAIAWLLNAAQWAAHHYPGVHAWQIAVLLQEKPELLAAVRSEVLSVGRLEVDRMPLLRGCIRESLRLHSLMALPRRVLRDLSWGGAAIPQGSVLAISPYLSHRSPAFPEPESFAPERWSSVGSPPPEPYLPGGGGRWGCVGMSLTEWLLALVFSHVLRRFDWALLGPRPQPRHGMLLLPDKRPTRASYRPPSTEA